MTEPPVLPNDLASMADDELLAAFHARAGAVAGDREREALIDEIKRRGIRLPQ